MHASFSDYAAEPMLPTLVLNYNSSPELGASETISPELALVDPELRRRARETLPEGLGGHRAGSADALSKHRPAGVAETAAETHETVAMRPRRNAVRRRLLPAAIMAVALLVLVTARPTALDFDGRDKRPATPLRSSFRNGDVSVGRIATPVAAQREPIVRPVAESTSRRARGTPARTQVAWTFVWPSHPAAAYYNVRFLRGQRMIFEAWPHRPRLIIPAQGVSRGRAFHFSEGRYRWIVRPGFGSRARRRYGQPIVLSTWTVARTASE